MYYIQDEKFNELLKNARRLNVDGWAVDERVEKEGHSLVESFDSGEYIGVSSGQWEERAQLYDCGGDQYLLRFQEVYWGQCYGDKEPQYYLVNKEVAR